MKIPPQAMEKLKEFAVKAFQEVLQLGKETSFTNLERPY